MDKYKLKDGMIDAIKFDGTNVSSGLSKFCQQYMADTARGMSRVYVGDYIVQDDGRKLIVLPARFFETIAEKVK